MTATTMVAPVAHASGRAIRLPHAELVQQRAQRLGTLGDTPNAVPGDPSNALNVIHKIAASASVRTVGYHGQSPWPALTTLPIERERRTLNDERAPPSPPSPPFCDAAGGGQRTCLRAATLAFMSGL
jgi:hypothetical protein